MASFDRTFGSGRVLGVASAPKPEFAVPEAQFQEMKLWAKRLGITTRDLVELDAFWHAFEGDEGLNCDILTDEDGEDDYIASYRQGGHAE